MCREHHTLMVPFQLEVPIWHLKLESGLCRFSRKQPIGAFAAALVIRAMGHLWT